MDGAVTLFRLISPLAVLLVMAVPAFGGEVVQIVQRDRSFSPAEVTIHVGDTVRFLNEDSFAHNMLSETPGFEFDLQLQKPGEIKEITFDHPGVVMVGCDIHTKMHLMITVK